MRGELSWSNEEGEGRRMSVRTFVARVVFVVGVVGVMSLLGAGPPPVAAHEMTERYIPIGESPGLSGKYTVIGKLQGVNARDRTCAIAAASGPLTVKITEKTKIWLDRSHLGLTNLEGTLADLRPGATVEVKPEGHERGVSSGPAEWIKVQVTASR
jgi:hypothetical protein